MLKDIGNVFTAKDFKSQGIVHGASDFIDAIDLAQSQNLAQMMTRVEVFVLEFVIKVFSTGRQG